MFSKNLLGYTLVLACGCASQPKAEPIRVRVAPPEAPHAREVPETEADTRDADCRRHAELATELSREGDQRVKIDVDGAIARYTDAAKLYPAEHRILWKLSWAFEKKEEWTNMVEPLRRAAELAPHMPRYPRTLGYALVMLAEEGDRSAYERAKEPLRKCVELDPNIAECHFWLGEAYRWTDDERSALVAYSTAIERDPAAGNFYPPLGALYLSLGFHQQAEAVLKEGTRLVEPNNKHLPSIYAMYVLLASVAKAQGDKTKMRQAAEQAKKYEASLLRPPTTFEARRPAFVATPVPVATPAPSAPSAAPAECAVEFEPYEPRPPTTLRARMPPVPEVKRK